MENKKEVPLTSSDALAIVQSLLEKERKILRKEVLAEIERKEEARWQKELTQIMKNPGFSS